jgi:DNA modification methylase
MTDEPRKTGDQPGLPVQTEVFQMPKRFGHVPVDEAPLGWDKEKRFEAVYPRVELPFQEVERVPFGHPELEPNRLYFGDCLHVMRMLPSESIDLIYIDPPFFSGKQYNLIFGDKSELRSFSDIWEGGLNGYLIWLNARLYEMKRLLKPTGSIYIHLDWHASHYVKVEMDKIFGYDHFPNDVAWCYSIGGKSRDRWARKHDSLLFYAKGSKWHFDGKAAGVARNTGTKSFGGIIATDEDGRLYQDKLVKATGKYYRYYLDDPKIPEDWWTDINSIQSQSRERIGYPTQKPKALLERIIRGSSRPNDVVADFFIGGGTTAVVAQELGRQWIACDISRVAVSLTADHVAKVVENNETRTVQMTLDKIPDFVVSNWGVYEVEKLTELDEQAFHEFIIKAYAGRLATGSKEIHGYKSTEPLFVGSPLQERAISVEDIAEFAKAVLKRSEEEEARGTMLGWAFSREAQTAAEQLLAQRRASIRFVRLKLVTLESAEFKAHVVERSAQYENLLTFVLPPAVRFSAERVGPLRYRFDASESQSLNPGGDIINVQWDFDYLEYFTSSPGFAFSRKKDGLAVSAEYEFQRAGKFKVACRMQDDVGGQATAIEELTVT